MIIINWVKKVNGRDTIKAEHINNLQNYKADIEYVDNKTEPFVIEIKAENLTENSNESNERYTYYDIDGVGVTVDDIFNAIDEGKEVYVLIDNYLVDNTQKIKVPLSIIAKEDNSVVFHLVIDYMELQIVFNSAGAHGVLIFYTEYLEKQENKYDIFEADGSLNDFDDAPEIYPTAKSTVKAIKQVTPFVIHLRNSGTTSTGGTRYSVVETPQEIIDAAVLNKVMFASINDDYHRIPLTYSYSPQQDYVEINTLYGSVVHLIGVVSISSSQNYLSSQPLVGLVIATRGELETKADKAIILTDTSSSYVFEFVNRYNTEIRLGEATSISLTFADGEYSEDYTSGLCFDSGTTPTAIDYSGSGILNWVGTDCVTSDGLSIFQPSANTHYDIVFYYNGTQFIGLVNGFVPATGNVVSE